jgi:hypothetical protein
MNGKILKLFALKLAGKETEPSRKKQSRAERNRAELKETKPS